LKIFQNGYDSESLLTYQKKKKEEKNRPSAKKPSEMVYL